MKTQPPPRQVPVYTIAERVGGTPFNPPTADRATSTVNDLGQKTGSVSNEKQQFMFEEAQAAARRTQAAVGAMSNINEPVQNTGSISNEKQQLMFEEAQAAARRTQAAGGAMSTVNEFGQNIGSVSNEKQHLMFQEAQATARRTQALAAQNANVYGYDPSHVPGSQYANPPRSDSTNPTQKPTIQQGTTKDVFPPSTSASIQRPGISAGASLYQSAISSINRQTLPSQSVSAPTNTSGLDDQGFKPQLGQSSTRASSVPQPVNQWPLASKEKDRMRYLEARRAVDHHQQQNSTDPVPYDALYPTNASRNATFYSGSVANLASGRSTAPPAQDVSSSNSRSPSNASLPPTLPLPRNTPMSSIENSMDRALQYSQPSRQLNAREEKALLKQKYEQEKAAGTLPSSDLQWSGPPPPLHRPPPPSDSSTRPLNAAEEKERLKARYEVADRAAATGLTSSPDPIPPPPSFYSHQWQTPNPPLTGISDSMPQYTSPLGPHPSGYQNGYANGSPQPQPQSVPSPPSLDDEHIHSPIPQRPMALARFPPNTDVVPPHPPPPNTYNDDYKDKRSVPLDRDPSISLGKRAVQRESNPPLTPEPAEYMNQEEDLHSSWLSESSGLHLDIGPPLSPLNIPLSESPPPIPLKIPLESD